MRWWSSSARVRDLPDAVRQVTEDPPGSGPARCRLRPASSSIDPHSTDDALVAVLAADLPGITPATVERLARPCAPTAIADGPGAGRQSSWSTPPAAASTWWGCSDSARCWLRLGAADWAGRPVRALLDPLIDVEVPALAGRKRPTSTPRSSTDGWDSPTRPAGD